MYKKTVSISLFNLATAVAMIFSLICYYYQINVFSYILAISLFLAIGVRGWIDEKVLYKEPDIKKKLIYKISSWILFISEAILIIGVWNIRLK